jgi:hypothetical protein
MTTAERERNRERARRWREKPENKARQAAQKKAFAQAHPEILRERKQAHYERNAEAIKAKQRVYGAERRAALRAEVIAAYGCRCACPGCHVVHAELLTVDHVAGGASHRQNRRSTRDIYAQIKAEGFPPTYQLLCGSCNLAKSSGAACPIAGEDH